MSTLIFEQIGALRQDLLCYRILFQLPQFILYSAVGK